MLRFLRATLKGWHWAIENPAQSGPLALEYDPALDAAVQTAQMESSIPLIHTGGDYIGWMKPEIWIGMNRTLLEQGLIDEPVDIDEIYTPQFIEQIYSERKL